MTTVSRFSHQKDAGLLVLNVVLWENLVILVLLIPRFLSYADPRRSPGFV